MLGQQFETPPGLHEHRDDRAGKYEDHYVQWLYLYFTTIYKIDFELWLGLFDEIT